MDSRFWSKLMDKIKILDFMSAKERNEWNENIRNFKVPEFTKEIVIPTIKNLFLSRRDFLARKVDGVFKSLSGTHLTNSPSGFNQKMIFNLIGGWGTVDSNRCEFLNDLRSVIYQLLGRDKYDNSSYSDVLMIQRNKEFGKWLEFDYGAMRMKVFKKGTAHLEVHESIAMQLNQILYYLYPQCIPSATRKREKAFKKFEFSSNYLKRETLKVLSDLRVKSNNSLHCYNDNKEVEEVLKSIGGFCFDSMWSFSYDPTNVISEIIRLGAIPDKKSYQFYPTEEIIANMAVDSLRIYSDYYTLLEPSAGIGNLVDKINNNRVDITCIEISDINSKILKEKGYSVLTMDFMEYPESNKFERILMNPPFANGQAKAHLEKAIRHLKEGGVLVAILPANFKNYKNESVKSIDVSEVIENGFLESGTSVSVVLLTISK